MVWMLHIDSLLIAAMISKMMVLKVELYWPMDTLSMGAGKARWEKARLDKSMLLLLLLTVLAWCRAVFNSQCGFKRLYIHCINQH